MTRRQTLLLPGLYAGAHPGLHLDATPASDLLDSVTWTD